jgi:predicted nucleotidyltransferase component of viral defense system
MPEEILISDLHLNKDEFRAALGYTETITGFSSQLIEKDYYCSLILGYLYFDSSDASLVFKGGTSLNKIHFGFYRMSEDLDFLISMAEGATRGDRRKAKNDTEQKLKNLSKELPIFSILRNWSGANNSTQYITEISYESVVPGERGSIKIEVALREPLLHEPVRLSANSLILNPFSGKPAVKGVPVRTMALNEAIAEKVRAALTRLKPAIRDLFDLWHAQSCPPKTFGFR